MFFSIRSFYFSITLAIPFFLASKSHAEISNLNSLSNALLKTSVVEYHPLEMTLKDGVPFGPRPMDNPKCLAIPLDTPCYRYRSPFEKNGWYQGMLIPAGWTKIDILRSTVNDVLSSFFDSTFKGQFDYYRYVFVYNPLKYTHYFRVNDGKQTQIKKISSFYNESRVSSDILGVVETCASNRTLPIDQFTFSKSEQTQVTVQGSFNAELFETVGINVGGSYSKTNEKSDSFSHAVIASGIAAIHEPYFSWKTLKGIVYIETFNSKTKKWGYLSPIENLTLIDDAYSSYPFKTIVDHYNPIFYTKKFVKAICSKLKKNSLSYKNYSNQIYVRDAQTISEE